MKNRFSSFTQDEKDMLWFALWNQVVSEAKFLIKEISTPTEMASPTKDSINTINFVGNRILILYSLIAERAGYGTNKK